MKRPSSQNYQSQSILHQLIHIHISMKAIIPLTMVSKNDTVHLAPCFKKYGAEFLCAYILRQTSAEADYAGAGFF